LKENVKQLTARCVLGSELFHTSFASLSTSDPATSGEALGDPQTTRRVSP
jgi:hypothetical protein